MSDNNNAPQTINLDSLSLEQLNGMKQSEESRLNALTARYAQLRAAAARLHASQNAIGEISENSGGSAASSSNKEVMVPLTESVYVPGTLLEKEKLLVEIGTGFYVEKTAKETNGFLERKLKIVDMNSENITKAVQATRSNLESIQIAMQGKILEIRARQEGQRHRTAVEGSGDAAAAAN